MKALLPHCFPNLTELANKQFDVTDAHRHFELQVPKRATKCEVLFNAILALSALHLSRVSAFDPSIAEAYHSRCNSLLIPLLNDAHSVTDESVLATVVILRKYEEMNGRLSGSSTIQSANHTLPY